MPRPPSRARPIRVAIANDVPFVVEGLRSVLAPFADRVEVIGTVAGDPKPSLDALGDRPDVILLDAFSRVGAGIDAASALLDTDPDIAIVIFTETDDLAHLFAALRIGVRGYLLKTATVDELVRDIERVADGELVVTPSLATEGALVAARTVAKAEWDGAHLGLSRREGEVLRSLARGRSVNEIGDELGVGRETVRSHLQQVYRKLGVNDRAAAVAVAWREGLGA